MVKPDMTHDMRSRIAEIISNVFHPHNAAGEAQCDEAAEAIIAALPDMVPELVWDDFPGRGAKATAWGKANYLITRWSDGRFELVESYPGHQGANLAGGFCATLESAKAAANTHHRAQIMKALGIGGDSRD